MGKQDFSIGDKQFKVRKLDAIKQFHILRRISPILEELLPALGGISKSAKNIDSLNEDEKFDVIAKFVGPIMKGLSQLSDEDANLVLFGLLSAVEIQQQPAGNWTSVVVGSSLMIQNLELPALMQLASQAFMFNLSGFFSALPQAS